MDMKKLLTVDDYVEAWRLMDAGEGWIAYKKDVDYFCPPDVIGFDRDQMGGGVGGISDAELRLAGFLYAIQPRDSEPDLSDVIEFAKAEGIPVVESPTVPKSAPVEDMLTREHVLLDDPEVGDLWKHLRANDRLSYALFLRSLRRQGWTKKWIHLAVSGHIKPAT
jgi:hypothetical protein